MNELTLSERIDCEGWARLECVGWGMPPNRVGRVWYLVSGWLLRRFAIALDVIGR